MTTEKTHRCRQVRKGPDSIVFNENTIASGIAELTLTRSINRSVGGAVEASSLRCKVRVWVIKCHYPYECEG